MDGLTLADQKILYTACRRAWNRIRGQFSHVTLPSQEWEDIEQEALIKVFRKAADHYDPSKGSIDTWVYRVIYHTVLNALRRSLPSKKSHRWRTRLQHARPIRVRTKSIGRWGEEVTVTEPDIVDPTTENKATIDWNDVMPFLDKTDRKVLKMKLEGATGEEIGNRLSKAKTRNTRRNRGYQLCQKLVVNCRLYLDSVNKIE